MFYSNALSVRRILLKIKKKPDQFEGGGKRKGGRGRKRCPKNSPINVKDPGTKKECPEEVVGLLLGHSVIVRR